MSKRVFSIETKESGLVPVYPGHYYIFIKNADEQGWLDTDGTSIFDAVKILQNDLEIGITGVSWHYIPDREGYLRLDTSQEKEISAYDILPFVAYDPYRIYQGLEEETFYNIIEVKREQYLQQKHEAIQGCMRDINTLIIGITKAEEL